MSRRADKDPGIDANFVAFQARLTELRELFPGQYVAFLGGELVGHGYDRNTLLHEVAESHPDQPVLIVLASDEPTTVRFRRPQRVRHH